jgi:hypothetical protein
MQISLWNIGTCTNVTVWYNRYLRFILKIGNVSKEIQTKWVVSTSGVPLSQHESVYYILYPNSDTNNSCCKIFWHVLCDFWGTLIKHLKLQVRASDSHSYQMLQDLYAVLSMDWHIISFLEWEVGEFYYEFSCSGSFISNTGGFSWLLGYQLLPHVYLFTERRKNFRLLKEINCDDMNNFWLKQFYY